MTSSKKNAISKLTSSDFRGVAKIDSSPMRDLELARQLTQRALDEGNIASACLFAIAAAKLIGPCSSHAIEHNELLTEAASMRVATRFIETLAGWLIGQNIKDSSLIVESITQKFFNEIKQ
jgi:hypothetical protein